MNSTQLRIYNYIKALIKNNNIPVMLSYHNIACKLNLSDITIIRNINWLVDNKYIYKAIYNKTNIYNTSPIDITHDFVCYIRNDI